MSERDEFKDALEAWELASNASSEQRDRMLEDMKFSNPADPDQWEPAVYKARMNNEGGARPTFVFDQTNQYIAQVVNDSRMNKPQIQTVPANSGADEKVSEALDGLIRQIEYASTASIAYDTAQEHAARLGLGWFRIITKVVDEELNQQEIRIVRVHDAMAVRYDPNFTMPDGSDQQFGFVESMIGKAQYLRDYDKSMVTNWKPDGNWYTEDNARICEYFKVVETQKNRILLADDLDESADRALKDHGFGGATYIGEDDYWEVRRKTGVKLNTRGNVMHTTKKVRWYKMDGNGFLDEGTDFPSQWIPLIPVIGYESWVEGKRYLCGMVRRMMSSQRAYNIERNAQLEWMSKQPKAPYAVDWESIEDFQKEWGEANVSDKAYLPYKSRNESGEPLAPPHRMEAPNPGAAFQNLGQNALADLQASIGMYKANLGAPSNESSGIAIKRREQQGDTANFHYTDNLARSMTHAGRIIVDMIPQVYDTKRAARILGIDNKSSEITIDPKMKSPFKMDGKKVAAINPNTGKYDVRCKVGPAYASLREEAAESLTKIVQQSPVLMTVLGPMWAEMQDWPQADKVSKLLLAMAPPQVQALENSDEEIPPQVMAQMQQMKQALDQSHQQMQQLGQMLQQSQGEIQQLQAGIQKDIQIAQIREQAATEREAMKLHANMQTTEFEQHSLDKREADKHAAVTAHVGMKEEGQNQRALAQHLADTNQQTAIQVAEINSETSLENARIAAIVQLVLKSMEPVQAAEQEIANSENESTE